MVLDKESESANQDGDHNLADAPAPLSLDEQPPFPLLRPLLARPIQPHGERIFPGRRLSGCTGPSVETRGKEDEHSQNEEGLNLPGEKETQSVEKQSRRDKDARAAFFTTVRHLILLASEEG